MVCNQMFELCYHAAPPQGSYIDIKLFARFSIGDETKTVKGFYDGNGIYKIRFLPQTPGKYSWQVFGIIQDSGEDFCEDRSEQGVIRAVGTHFEDANGNVFRPFGTTVYALPHQKLPLISQTIQTLQRAPFNKVRYCIFPKYYDYNRDEPELFPFEREGDRWNVHRPCIAFWQRLESVILQLADSRIQSDLIMFHAYDKWGFSGLTMQENFVYLDYVLRRFSAFPFVWWSLANEFDLLFARTLQDWYALERFIFDNDVFGHLLSVHNCFSFYDHHREAISHCSVQSGQIESAAKFIQDYAKPVIFDECGYEGNIAQDWGNMSGFALVNSFWTVIAQGAYCTHGETFVSDDEILWWSKGGVFKGESVPRLAFLKGIVDGFPSYILPWHADPLEGIDPEQRKLIMDTPFRKLIREMPERQQESCFVRDAKFMGRCGDDVFLQYLGRHCCAELEWRLPEDKRYEIHVVDVWEMTDKIACRNICGKVTIPLPGKEGIAVIAYRRE